MPHFSDENTVKKFKSGLEPFSASPQQEIKSDNVLMKNQEPMQRTLTEPPFEQSNPSIQNDYGYNIPDNQTIPDSAGMMDILTDIQESPVLSQAQKPASSGIIINSSLFTPESRSKESEYSEGKYIYHDFFDKTGERIFPKEDKSDHDKMAYKEKETKAGGGAAFDYKFTDKGKLKAEISLAKGKDKADNKGFKNRTIHFTEKAEEVFDYVKPEDNEALASFSDSKIEAVLTHSSRKHIKKSRRYADIKGTSRKDISQLKKEIRAEKKAKEQSEINANFNASNTQFTDDRSGSFQNRIDEKFQTKEKQERISSLFTEPASDGTASKEKAERTEVKKNTDKMELFTDDDKKSSSSASASKQSIGQSKAVDGSIDAKFEQRGMTRAEKLEQSKSEEKAAKKAEKKEVKKAAAVAAVSKMFEAKKNVQNQLGDMSGQSSGDLMKDGSTGLLQTMTGALKELLLGAARKMAVVVGKVITPIASAVLVPVCVCFLIIAIMSTTFSAIGGLLGADDGVSYDLDVNGDGYVYTSLSEEQIDEIIAAIYDNYPDMGATQEAVLRYSLSKVGCAYDQDYHGNLNVNIFDCSSLAYRAYRDSGIDISNSGAYSAAEECHAMINAGNTVTGDMQPGDLIFYGGSDNGRYMGIYHVAIYVGRVDGVDKMVEARGKSYGVVYCDVRAGNVVNVSRPY